MDSQGRMNVPIEIRQTKLTGGLDGNRLDDLRGREEGDSSANNANRIIRTRAGMKVKRNYLVNKTTGLMTEPAILWEIRSLGVPLNLPNSYILYKGLAHSIEEIRPVEGSRNRLEIVTRQKVADWGRLCGNGERGSL